MSYYRTDFVLCNHSHILVVDYMSIEYLITFGHIGGPYYEGNQATCNTEEDKQ